MDQAVVTGLFTLGGVIVGGATNAGVAAALDARSGRRALRTSARLVADELGTDGAILFATREVGRWLPMGNAPLRLDAWQEHAGVLAEHLPDDEWRDVRTAYRQVRMIDRVHRLGAPDRPFSPMDGPHLLEAAEAVEAAAKVLDRY